MSTHAPLSPSNKRWPKCAGSPRMEKDYPDIPGEAAIDGTGSHLLLEMCLENNVPATSYDGQLIGANHEDQPNGWMVHHDRIKRVQMCLDYIARRVTELKEIYPGASVTVESESRSDPGGMFGRDDWYGTCDVTIIVMGENKCLFIEVIDYKDGRGWVTVTSDSQLLAYLGGKLRIYIASGPDLVRPFNPQNVGGCRMTIVQPKTKPPIRYEDMMPHTVMQKVNELKEAADRTDDPNAPCTPGEHCQWCKANPKRGGHCTAEADQSLATLEDLNPTEGGDQSLFEYIGNAVGDVTTLTVEQLADLADARPGIEVAFDKVDEEIQKRLEMGDDVPGYAMKPGRSSNVWSGDEESIIKMLKARRFKQDDIFPKKLASPAQVLKNSKLNDKQKETIQKDYITSLPGKLKLTKVARVKKQSAELMFADVAKKEVSFF